MYLYKFEEGEVIVNTLTAYPSHDMYLYEQNVYIDRRPELTGAFVENVTMVPLSDVSLFELNIDRPST